MSWWPDTMNRWAAEYPDANLGLPRLMDNNGLCRLHETGVDDDTQPLTYTLQSSQISVDKNNAMISGVVPDSTQTGNCYFQVKTKLFPQSTNIYTNSFTVTPTTEQLQLAQMGRFWQYVWNGTDLGCNFQMGKWYEALQSGAPQ